MVVVQLSSHHSESFASPSASSSSNFSNSGVAVEDASAGGSAAVLTPPVSPMELDSLYSGEDKHRKAVEGDHGKAHLGVYRGKEAGSSVLLRAATEEEKEEEEEGMSAAAAAATTATATYGIIRVEEKAKENDVAPSLRVITSAVLIEKPERVSMANHIVALASPPPPPLVVEEEEKEGEPRAPADKRQMCSTHQSAASPTSVYSSPSCSSCISASCLCSPPPSAPPTAALWSAAPEDSSPIGPKAFCNVVYHNRNNHNNNNNNNSSTHRPHNHCAEEKSCIGGQDGQDTTSTQGAAAAEAAKVCLSSAPTLTPSSSSSAPRPFSVTTCDAGGIVTAEEKTNPRPGITGRRTDDSSSVGEEPHPEPVGPQLEREGGAPAAPVHVFSDNEKDHPGRSHHHHHHHHHQISGAFPSKGGALKALSPAALLDVNHQLGGDHQLADSDVSPVSLPLPAPPVLPSTQRAPALASSPIVQHTSSTVVTPHHSRHSRHRAHRHRCRGRADDKAAAAEERRQVKSGVRLNPYVRCVQRSSSVPQIRSLTQLLYETAGSSGSSGIWTPSMRGGGGREILPAEPDTPCHSLSSYPAGVATAILEQQQQQHQERHQKYPPHRDSASPSPPQFCGLNYPAALSATTPFSSVSSAGRIMSPVGPSGVRMGGGGGGDDEDSIFPPGPSTCTPPPQRPMLFSPLPQTTAAQVLPHQHQHLLASSSTTSTERLPLSSPVEDNGLLFTPLMSAYDGSVENNGINSHCASVHAHRHHYPHHHHHSNSLVSAERSFHTPTAAGAGGFSHGPKFTAEAVTTPHTLRSLIQDSRRHQRSSLREQSCTSPSLPVSGHHRLSAHQPPSLLGSLGPGLSRSHLESRPGCLHSATPSYATNTATNVAHHHNAGEGLELGAGESQTTGSLLYSSAGIGIGVGGEYVITPSSSGGYFTTPEMEPASARRSDRERLMIPANTPGSMSSSRTAGEPHAAMMYGSNGGVPHSAYTSAVFTPTTLSTASTPTATGHHYHPQQLQQRFHPQQHRHSSLASFTDSYRTSSLSGAVTSTVFGNLLLPPTTAAAAAAAAAAAGAEEEEDQKHVGQERVQQDVEGERNVSSLLTEQMHKRITLEANNKALLLECAENRKIASTETDSSREELQTGPTSSANTTAMSTTMNTVPTVHSSGSVSNEWPMGTNITPPPPPPAAPSSSSLSSVLTTAPTTTTITTTNTTTPIPGKQNSSTSPHAPTTDTNSNTNSPSGISPPANANTSGAFVIRQRPLIPRSSNENNSRNNTRSSSSRQAQRENMLSLQKAAPPHPPPMLGGASSYHYILRNFSEGTFKYYSSEETKVEFLEVCHRVLKQVRAVLEQETLHPEVGLFPQISAPAYVFGDIHGNFEDLSFFLRRILLFNDFSLTPANMICLGDYVDRGAFSLECVMLLFSLKVMNPGKLVMLRGNHEDRAVCGDLRTYGTTCFASQCQRVFGFRRGMELFREVTEIFRYLPLAAELLIPPQPQVVMQSCGGGPDSTGVARMFMSYPCPSPPPPPPPQHPSLLMTATASGRKCCGEEDDEEERGENSRGGKCAAAALSCSLVQGNGEQIRIPRGNYGYGNGCSCYGEYGDDHLPGMMMSMGSRILCTHGGIPRFTADPLQQNALGMLRHLQYPRLLTLFPQHASVRDRPETAANFFHRELLPGLLKKYPAYARLWMSGCSGVPHAGAAAPPPASTLLCRPMTEEQLRQAWFSMFDLLWSDPMDVDMDDDNGNGEDLDEDEDEEKERSPCDSPCENGSSITASTAATTEQRGRVSLVDRPKGSRSARRREASLPPPSSEPFGGGAEEAPDDRREAKMNGKERQRRTDTFMVTTGKHEVSHHGHEGAEVSPPCLLPLTDQEAPATAVSAALRDHHSSGGSASSRTAANTNTVAETGTVPGKAAGSAGAVNQWGFGVNGRGSQVLSFSTKAVETFLRSYGYLMLFRAHQEKAHGLRWSKNNRVLTIFSTSNYLSHGNGAGCVVVSATGEIQMIEKVPE